MIDPPLHHALRRSSLGWVWIEQSAVGLRRIDFLDSPAPLLTRMTPDERASKGREGSSAFDRVVCQVLEFVESPVGDLSLPVDLHGSPFQLRVWQALRSIPPGTTLAYAELAERIGARGAARAVARACATNPVAVVIPCHRVVRSNGDLAGYRWGIERKRELLRREVALRAGASEAASAQDPPGISLPTAELTRPT